MPANTRLLVLPGDGIGPEVVAEVRRVIDGMDQRRTVSFDISEGLLGGGAYDKTGSPLPDETIEAAQLSGVLLRRPADGAAGVDSAGTLKDFKESAERAFIVQKLREMDLFKLPGVAETIDWTSALTQLNVISLDPESIDSTLGALLKYQDDISRIQGSEAAGILDQIRKELAAAGAS